LASQVVQARLGPRREGRLEARQDLFDIEEAVQKGTIIQMLVSDAASAPSADGEEKPQTGDALYFSHGFSIAYKKQTGVIPPKNVDVIMVAPKAPA